MESIASEIIRLVLLDDHDAERTRLARRLAVEPHISIVGQAADGSDALELSQQLEPDAVLVETRRRDNRGLEVISALSAIEQQRRPAIVAYIEIVHRGDWLDARIAGADDVLLKEMAPASLVRELSRIVNRVRSHARPDAGAV